VGSAIESLVDHRIEVCTKSLGIDPRRAGGRFGKGRSEYKAPWLNGPQFCYRCAVACDHDRPAGLYFTEHGCGLITQFSLCDGSVHKRECSTCSTL
jgi:hypothetical protein